MVRIAKEPDPKRINALKKRIQDERYLDEAIHRLADKLTTELVERHNAEQLEPSPNESEHSHSRSP